MQNHRLLGLALCLFGLASTGQNAAAATVDFTANVRASCSITGIDSPIATSVYSTHLITEIGYVSVSSIGKPSLAVYRVTAFDASGVQQIIPVHLIALRAIHSSGRSEVKNGIPHLILNRRSERVTVSIAPQALKGLTTRPYRFEISALCAGGR